MASEGWRIGNWTIEKLGSSRIGPLGEPGILPQSLNPTSQSLNRHCNQPLHTHSISVLGHYAERHVLLRLPVRGACSHAEHVHRGGETLKRNLEANLVVDSCRHRKRDE